MVKDLISSLPISLLVPQIQCHSSTYSIDVQPINNAWKSFHTYSLIKQAELAVQYVDANVQGPGY